MTSLYAPTSPPPTLAAGLPRPPLRLLPNGKCQRCVCEICICGNHHCPPTPRQLHARAEEKQATLSTHSHSTYTAPPSSSYPQRALPPVNALHKGGKWEGNSSYATSFVPHPYSPALPSSSLSSPPLFDTSSPLSSSTTTSSSFPRHSLPPPITKRPPSPFHSAGSFIASSTYSDLFPIHSSTPPSLFRPSHALLTEDEDRDFLTDASAHYKGQQGEARRPLQRLEGAMRVAMGEDEGEKVSESQAQYVRHTTNRVSPVIPVTLTSYNDDDGEARVMMSESMVQYGQKSASLAFRVRPSPAIGLSDERFEGQSVMRADYREYQPSMESQNVKEEKVREVECDDRTWETESRRHFNKKPRGEIGMTKPVTKATNIVFDDERRWETETRTFYTNHGDCVRPIVEPIRPRMREEETFEGLSTMQDSYQGSKGEGRRELMRPMDALKEKEKDDRSWVSESRYHYQKKNVEACPAGELEDRHFKDRHGHLYYEKGPEDKKWRRIYAHSQQITKLW